MPFEMTALCAFPWDFADKGLDATLARCRDLGVSHVFLAVSYHAGYFFYPDNPVRRVHLLEDGVTYFRPRPEFYRDTPLKPLAATMCEETDWVEAIADRIEHYGLKLGAWTVCFHNTRLGLLHPASTIENALGDRYPHALCPSDPDAQAYVRGLVRDLTSRFPLDFVMLEAPDYRGRRHGGDWVGGHHHERDGIVLAPLEQTLLDLSFAPSDLAAAARDGIDGDALRQTVREHLEDCLVSFPARPAARPATLAEFEAAMPALTAYRACLHRQVEQLIGQIKSDIAPTGVQLIGGKGEACDWLLAGAYGQPPSGVAAVTTSTRAAASPDQKVLTAIRLGFNPPTVAAVHSLTQLEQCVTAAGEGGADGVAFYNLAESPGHALDWIRPALQRSRPRPDPDLAPLRLGLIGCGGISEAYLRAARRVEGVRITAVADIDLDLARRRASEFQIPMALGSADELLEHELDAVIIAVPPKWHAQIFKASLDAGKHVLVEKPLGFDLAEANAMAAWAATSDRVTALGLVHRYLPFYRVILDLIRAGSFGAVRQIRVRTGRDFYTDPRFVAPATTRGGWLTDPAIAGGGILMSSSVHFFSVCSFLVDDSPFRKVSATVRALDPRAYPGIEDDARVSIETAAGCELLIEDSWVRFWPLEVDVLGERGHLRVTGPSWTENVVLTGRLSGPIPPSYSDLSAPDGFTVNAARYADRCPPLFEGLLADFAASLRASSPLPTLPDVAHARAMQAAITAAYESSRRQAVVPL